MSRKRVYEAVAPALEADSNMLRSGARAREPWLEDRRNKIRRPLLWLLTVGIVASLIFPVYVIRQGAGQTLLWNKDEAFLFVDTTTSATN
jgi:hypothetical protein